MNLEVIATNDEYSNTLNGGIRIVSFTKLPRIYKELREKVFIGEPIQENSGDNHLVYSGKLGPNGNYGWQLFKTSNGTAILEYLGPVSYYSHERRPLSLEKEEHLKHVIITFHQKEKAVDTAREIVDKYTKKREVSLQTI